jgi:hypothetical protein
MADIKSASIEIHVNSELVQQIQWLMKYKAAADEALSYLITNEKDAHAAKLILNALNIGAHEQPQNKTVHDSILKTVTPYCEKHVMYYYGFKCPKCADESSGV